MFFDCQNDEVAEKDVTFFASKANKFERQTKYDGVLYS